MSTQYQGRSRRLSGRVAIIASSSRIPSLLLSLLLLIALEGCEPHSEPDPISAGQEIFALSGCGLCHGEAGRGDGPLVRSGRVASVDLGDSASYRYGREIEEVASVIAEGRTSGRGFMPPHAHLSEGERDQLAIYVLELSSEADNVSKP